MDTPHFDNAEKALLFALLDVHRGKANFFKAIADDMNRHFKTNRFCKELLHAWLSSAACRGRTEDKLREMRERGSDSLRRGTLPKEYFDMANRYRREYGLEGLHPDYMSRRSGILHEKGDRAASQSPSKSLIVKLRTRPRIRIWLRPQTAPTPKRRSSRLQAMRDAHGPEKSGHNQSQQHGNDSPYVPSTEISDNSDQNDFAPSFTRTRACGARIPDTSTTLPVSEDAGPIVIHDDSYFTPTTGHASSTHRERDDQSAMSFHDCFPNTNSSTGAGSDRTDDPALIATNVLLDSECQTLRAEVEILKNQITSQKHVINEYEHKIALESQRNKDFERILKDNLADSLGRILEHMLTRDRERERMAKTFNTVFGSLESREFPRNPSFPVSRQMWTQLRDSIKCTLGAREQFFPKLCVSDLPDALRDELDVLLAEDAGTGEHYAKFLSEAKAWQVMRALVGRLLCSWVFESAYPDFLSGMSRQLEKVYTLVAVKGEKLQFTTVSHSLN